MSDAPKIVGPGAGVLSGMGFSAPCIDLGNDAVPAEGADILIMPKGGLEALVRIGCPKGSLLMLIDPQTAVHLRAQVKRQQEASPPAAPRPPLRVVP